MAFSILRSGASALAVLAGGLLDLVYPRVCLHCGRPAPEAALPLCGACLRRARVAEPDEVAARARALPPALRAAGALHVLWVFEPGGPVQTLHHALKYGNRPLYGETLGRLLGARLEQPLPEVVLPVPLHRARFYERGYNQSDALAHGIEMETGLPVRTDVLARRRATRSQTTLSAAHRMENVAGAFEVRRPADVAGRHVLLVDDILTTGATMASAAEALHAAGAARVDVAALAVAGL